MYRAHTEVKGTSWQMPPLILTAMAVLIPPKMPIGWGTVKLFSITHHTKTALFVSQRCMRMSQQQLGLATGSSQKYRVIRWSWFISNFSCLFCIFSRVTVQFQSSLRRQLRFLGNFCHFKISLFVLEKWAVLASIQGTSKGSLACVHLTAEV